MNLRQLPNSLSAFRIIAAPIMMILILVDWDLSYITALAVFVLASISDSLDGYFARRQKLVSNLGIFLDLTADKALISAVLIALVEAGFLPSWLVATIIVREFIVTGLRTYAAAEGIVVPAGKWGKRKTVITTIAIGAMLLYGDIVRGGWLSTVITDPNIAGWFVAAVWLMYITLIITVASGIHYLVTIWPLLGEKEGRPGSNLHE